MGNARSIEDISYAVTLFTDSLDSPEVVKSFEFKDVLDAIDFYEKQEDGDYNWWEVNILWD